MSAVPLNISRVTMQMQGSLLLGNLQNTQAQLLTVQQQLSSGQQLNLPSDNPAAAVNIISLKQQIADNTNYASNLNYATGSLGQADSALSSLSTLINQAQSIASSDVGSTATADQRAADAQVVQSLMSQALALANTTYQGQSVFGGQSGTQSAFASVGGGYLYQGTSTPLSMLTPTGGSIQYTLAGNSVFGPASAQVTGGGGLAPALTPSTRLTDLDGAQDKGVSPGSLLLTVGNTTTTVNLANAASVTDVVNMLNAGFTAAGSDASAAITGGALVITGDSTQNISLADPAGGSTAASLGLAGTVASGTTFTGANLQPRITATTPLSALSDGAGIDPSGLIISNGANSATISLTGLNTVQDLLNAINSSGTYVRAQINPNGTGINVQNSLSGTALSIGENGGSTATELGIRSFNAQSALAGFNNGAGVTPSANSLAGPKGQILVTGTDGAQFYVQMDGVRTPAQLIAAINSAAGNTTVTAALNPTGNGITLTDTSGGAGNLTVAAGANYVGNGTNLGIFQTGTGGTLTGSNLAFSTDDFQITRRDGTSFTVSVAGDATVQDVLNSINNADGNSDPATKVAAALNPKGNGIQLSDPSTGPGSLTVAALNGSSAASQLGLAQTASAASPGVITGADANTAQAQGVFSSLAMLCDALQNNDPAGIQRAAALLQTDNARAIQAGGVVGAREQDVAARQSAATDQNTQLQQALSLLNDTDFTTAATRLQQLETAYQASLQVAQTTNNLSLLDFLK